MTNDEIKIGHEYAYRPKPRPGEPIEHVKLLRHVRRNRWQVEWLEGDDTGLKDL